MVGAHSTGEKEESVCQAYLWYSSHYTSLRLPMPSSLAAMLYKKTLQSQPMSGTYSLFSLQAHSRLCGLILNLPLKLVSCSGAEFLLCP